MLTIYVDADACPVKGEVYKVARRYALRVAVVANACSSLCISKTPPRRFGRGLEMQGPRRARQ